jgi:fibronectin type 3 domain-containing protein
VKLNWNASKSSGVSGYQVYRSTVSGGYFGLLASAAGLSYTDQSVQGGTTYFYAIKAKNSAGALSAYSNQVQVAIPRN